MVVLDTTGRTYSLLAHSLPSARGQGEPLTGRLSPPPQASFHSVLLGKDDDHYVMYSSFGYGFVCTMADMYSRAKAGKVVLNPGAGQVMSPCKVDDLATDRLALVSSSGYLLILPLTELPVLSKGKGNKLLGMPPVQLKDGTESLTCAIVVPQGGTLVVHAGKRHKAMKPVELDEYQGERGKRGKMLPRGYQHVSHLDVS